MYKIIEKKIILFFLIIPNFFVMSHANETKKDLPKYGPLATRLYLSHEYIQKNKAPDFWALTGYYVPQYDNKSCSVAAISMVINAARAGQQLLVPDELIVPQKLLKLVGDPLWTKAMSAIGMGVTLDEMKNLIVKSFDAFHIKISVEVVHAEEQKKFEDKLHSVLIENEKSDKNFIIANFLQNEFTGDPEGAVGHFAPVAAYDVIQKRVLIFDPDREYYEPYWVPERIFLKGINTQDVASKQKRGYLFIKLI